MKIKLVRTCGACPEQYDAFDETGKQVAYLRLRHGNFTVDCPNALDERIYFAHPKGDGEFFDDEREMFLMDAIKSIQEYYKEPQTGEYLLEDEWKE